MVGKSILNAKNVICLCVALVVGAGFVWAEKNKKDNKDNNDTSENLPVDAEIKEDDTNVLVLSEGRLAPSIPELTCQFIRFDDDRAVFVNLDGDYAFTEYGLYPDEMVVTTDNGEKITLSSNNGTLSMSCEGEPVKAFVFEGHLISLEGDELFYDESHVERRIDTFSAYQLNEECVIECSGKGSYRLRNKDGKIVKNTTIKDVSGLKLEVKADENGFLALDEEGYYYPVLQLNGDHVHTTPDHRIYVNGEELVPLGWNDRYVDPDAKGKGDEPIEPTKPEDRGPVDTGNDGIKEISYEMIEYVNEVRERYGLPLLYGIPALDDAAQLRADELTADFSHERADGDPFETVLGELNVWWNCGESIAKTSNTSTYTLFDELMSSDENRALLLDPKMKYLAAAFSEKDGVYYWDVLFYNDSYIP